MHNAALQAMIASIESNLGFTVLVGHPGTGKTTLLFHLLAQYQESARTAFIFQTQGKPNDLIRHIAYELELPAGGRDEVSFHQKLNGMLLKEARAGRKVLIVIDEAQNLQTPSLEAVRLLSDFETGPSKLLNIVLSGSPRLAETLLSPDLSQLAQRISTIARLKPLTEKEVRDYVRFRLAVAATGSPEGLFSPESLIEIASHSGGVPRIVNSICYRSLVLAYTHGQSFVSKELVKQAASDLDLSERSSRDSRDALPLPEAAKAPASNSTHPSISQNVRVSGDFVTDQLPRKPLAQSFVAPATGVSVDAKRFAQAAHGRACVGRPDINNLSRQRISAEADQSSRIGDTSRGSGWYRHPSTRVIAVLALLAFGSWLGWNELRANSSTSARDSSQSQTESLPPEVPPSIAEAKNGVPQNSVQQPNRFATASSMDSSRHPSPSQVPALIDVRPDLLLPSRIGSQPLTTTVPQASSNIVILSMSSDNLASLAAGPPVLPRLEPPKIIGPSSPGETYSPEPVKIIQPEYPLKARLWHIEGVVQVELTIDRNGNVQKVRRLNGNSILLQAAEQAVRQWRYTPSTGGQISAPAVTRVQFNFKLNPEARYR